VQDGSINNLIYNIMEFWKILEPAVDKIVPNGSLYKLTLYETPRNFIEYYGE
jgi:6-pyruvoyltetrahydropterin/6-carboxytetrahydropterin synthase